VPTTKAVLFCLPSGNLTESADQAMEANPWFETAIMDLHQNWRGVVWGMGSSFIVGFIFLYAVAFLTRPLTYIIIIGIMVASFCLFTVSLLETGRLPKAIQDVVRDIVKDSDKIVLPAEGAEPDNLVDFFCIFWGSVFCISFTVLAAMRQRLAIAIGVVEESSRALIGMPTLLAVPLGTLFSTIFVSATISIPSLLFTYSLREWDGEKWIYPQDVQIMLAILGFGSIWIFTFINSLQFTAVAGAVCDWYFTPDKSKRQGLLDSSMTLIRSYARILRYHLGSMAFGSLVVAIVKTIRYILMYISAQIQAQFPNSKLVKILVAVVNCCVACFERLIKYLTETAYIQIALWGTSFWRSAVSGVKLAIQNLGRLAFVTIMSKCLVLLGKLEISVASAFMCALYIWTKDQTGKGMNICDAFDIGLLCEEAETLESEAVTAAEADLTASSWGAANLSALQSSATASTGANVVTGAHVPTLGSFNEAIFRFPTFVALMCGYFVGSVFMDCFDITIHTIIVCFCEDEKYCDGGDPLEAPNDYPYYAAGSLEEVLGPAIELGRSKKKTRSKIKDLEIQYKQDITRLKDKSEMDDKERAEAGEKEEDLNEQRLALQEAANAEVAKLQIREAEELKAVAAKMADKNKKRKAMRKSGAGSTRNMDKAAFLEAYKEGLEAKGIDAEKEFSKLDADGSGDLSAEELKAFSDMTALGRHDV